VTQQTPQEEPGWALKRILGIHKGIRGDLALLRSAVTAVTEDGADVDTAMSAVQNLSINNPGWTFRTYCDNFCSFVHEHHSTEDSLVFPGLLAMRGEDTDFKSLIEKLQADHRTLTGYLNEVEQALSALPGDGSAKTAAASAMERLSEHLEAHLSFEEENLAPALNAMSKMVPESEAPPAPPPPEHWGLDFS
jgi:hemerythrin-like domain-containing protein